MKKCSKLKSLRGSINQQNPFEKKHLILDDGLINNGMKVISFTMWTTTGGNQAGCDATLSLAPIPSGLPIFDASDNRQIAWVTGGMDNGMITQEYREFIDPDHVVNRDLYLTVGASIGELWNYLIIFEQYALSDDEAIVQIIKETSQGIQN